MRQLRLLIVSGVMAIIMVMAVSPFAWAADYEWQLYWNSVDGVIRENITGGDLDAALLAAAGFTSNSAASYTRTVDGWEAYMAQSDRLPLALGGRDLKAIRFLTITGAAVAPDNRLAAGLAGQSVAVALFTGGIVRETSGELSATDEYHCAVWQFESVDALGQRPLLLKLWLFDGFWCAVLIIVLGAAGLALYFRRRMRKVDQLIKSQYSLESIDIRELELEVERELDRLEQER